jgi:hypothetical protein
MTQPKSTALNWPRDWFAANAPCHADVLLELANGE